MRKIKFRAWDNDKGSFFKPIHKAYVGELEDLLIKLNGRLNLNVMYGIKDESLFLDRFVLMQYTGLKDKNNKEVYESDIYINHDNGCIGVLSYDDYGLLATEYKDGRLYNNRPFRDLDTTNFEIIGNKYENPDLIK